VDVTPVGRDANWKKLQKSKMFFQSYDRKCIVKRERQRERERDFIHQILVTGCQTRFSPPNKNMAWYHREAILKYAQEECADI